MHKLQNQTLLSLEIAARRILVRPPEPAPKDLMPNPTDSIYFGKTALLHVPVFWNFKVLANPHIAVMGMTGSGKSYFIKTFLTRASIVWNVNALILDWSGEYVQWVRACHGKVVCLGKEHSLNLLDLAGLEPEDRAKQIIGALDVLSDIGKYPQQKRITEEAILSAYSCKGYSKKHNKRKKNGRGRNKGKNPQLPTLHDVVSILRHWKNSRKFDKPALELCIHRLLPFVRKGRDFFARQSGISLPSLTTSGLVCIDLSKLPSESERSLAGLTLLQFLREKMRLGGSEEGKQLKLIVVADEAWKIAQDERSDLVGIVREGRKYSFGLIVASQNPTDISKTILSNAATVMVFRLQLPEFKNYIRETLHYNDAVADAMEKFGVGQVAAHMAFERASSETGTFIISKIDGEELPAKLGILGDNMNLEIDKEELEKRLLRLGCTDIQASSIMQLFEEHDRNLHVVKLVRELTRYGFSRSVLLVFLRELGVPDKELPNVFSSLEASLLGAGRGEFVELVVK